MTLQIQMEIWSLTNAGGARGRTSGMRVPDPFLQSSGPKQEFERSLLFAFLSSRPEGGGVERSCSECTVSRSEHRETRIGTTPIFAFCSQGKKTCSTIFRWGDMRSLFIPISLFLIRLQSVKVITVYKAPCGHETKHVSAAVEDYRHADVMSV